MATSASAAPEAWLQNQLLAMRDALPFLDADMVSGLVSYCPNASDADVAEYLSNIVGESDQSMAVVSGYLERRRQMKQGGSPSQPPQKSPQNPPRNARGKQQQEQQQQQQQQAQDYSHTKYSHENPNIEVYVKPKFDEASGSVSAPSRRTGAGGGLGEGGSAGGAEAPEGAAASGAAGGKVGGRTGGGVGGGAGGSAGGGKSAGGRKRRGGVAVGLADLEQGRVFKQGAPCECQAAIHHLVNNCLACGRIVCEQEGEGPCKFCGALVLRGSDSMGDAAPGAGMEGEWEEWEEVGGAAAGTTESEAKALAFRDRLVEYNRTSAQRTVVIDDQSDYFKSNGADGDGDAWLTNEEREILRRREEEREREEEERRRRVVVTLDLIGRRVLVADSPGADVAGGGADVAGSEGTKPGQEGSEKQTKGASGGASGRRGGGRTGVGSIFLMGEQGGQGGRGQGDREQGERDQIPTVKKEVVSGIKVLIKGEGGGGGGLESGGSGRTRLMPSPNLPIAAPVFVKPSSANSSTDGASGTGAGAGGGGGASSNEATGQGKKGGKGKKGQQEQQHVREQESDRRRGAYKEGMARLQHDSPLMEAMREIEEEVGGRSGGGGNRRIDKERGSRGGGVGNQGVGYRGVSVGEGGGRGVIGGGTAGGGLDPWENRDRDGPCGIPADLAGLADLADDEADVDGRFDICVQMDQRGGLLRGVGVGGGRGVEAGIDGGRGGVLQDGVVLLKGWLTREQQVM
ncbi:unnamed protein product [Closterium sp. NIES-54]